MTTLLVSNLILCILLGFPGAYAIHLLFLERKDSHEGPFRSKQLKVRWLAQDGLPEETQHVCLWDWIRRVFGAYDVSGDVWTVNEWRSQRWTCPYCLSFWSSLIISVPLFFILEPFWLWPLYHFTICSASITLYLWWNHV